jgi:hypothetical protein
MTRLNSLVIFCLLQHLRCSALQDNCGAADECQADDDLALLQGSHSRKKSHSQLAAKRALEAETGDDNDDDWTDGSNELKTGFSKCTEQGVNGEGTTRALKMSEGTYIPVFSSEPLYTEAAHITHVVLWLHGRAAQANEYFCNGLGVAKSKGTGKYTLTVAPYFGTTAVSDQRWLSDLPSSSVPYAPHSWSNSGWMAGADSAHIDRHSSYQIMDKIVAHFNGPHFPNVKRITLAGFSAGCQFLARWSVLSPEVKGKVRVIASDCGSYLYFDKQRPSASCATLENTGKDHSCDSFEVPNPEPKGFNDWKYGLHITENQVSKSGYLAQFRDDAAPNKQSAAVVEAIATYPSKDIRFLLGTDDVCNCNTPGMNNDREACFIPGLTCLPTAIQGCCDTYPDTSDHNSLAAGPRDNIQGSNRLQRALNYMSYLTAFYKAKGIDFKPTFDFFKGGHDAKAFGNSAVFEEWAFGP